MCFLVHALFWTRSQLSENAQAVLVGKLFSRGTLFMGERGYWLNEQNSVERPQKQPLRSREKKQLHVRGENR